MSRFIDISITGDKKLAKKFKKLERKVQSKIMKDAAKKAMIPVQQLAISQAPEDSGRTKRNIKIATFRGKWGVGAVVQTGTRNQMGISSGAGFYYPAAHEYGTKYITDISAFGFMRAAMKERRRRALGILTYEIRKMMLFKI